MKLAIPQKRLGPLSFFVCVLIINMASILSVDMYVPALPGMQREFGVTEAYLNLTMFSFFASQAVGVLAFGPLSDRLGRRKTLVLCNILYLLGTLGCMISPTVEVLTAFRAVEAFAFGGVVVLCTALIQDAYEGEDLRKAQSALQSLILVGPAMAPFLGSLMLVLFDWRSIFAFLAVCGLVAVGLSLLMSETSDPKLHAALGEDSQAKGPKAVSPLKELLCNRSFTSFALFMGMAGVPWFAFIAVVSYVVMNFFGSGYLEYSFIYAAVSLVSVISPFIYLALAKRLSVKAICRFAMGLVLLTLAGLVFLGKVSPVVFALAFLPYVLAEGIVRPMAYVVLLDQPSDRVGLASSVVNFCYAIITSFATVIATLPWANFIDGLAWIALGTLVAMAVLYLIAFAGKARR